MNPIDIINKYYPEENELRHILLTHSRSVADKSLWIADRHPELSLDKDFLYEAAMLHDIGVVEPDLLSENCDREVILVHFRTGALGESHPHGAALLVRDEGPLSETRENLIDIVAVAVETGRDELAAPA